RPYLPVAVAAPSPVTAPLHVEGSLKKFPRTEARRFGATQDQITSCSVKPAHGLPAANLPNLQDIPYVRPTLDPVALEIDGGESVIPVRRVVARRDALHSCNIRSRRSNCE